MKTTFLVLFAGLLAVQAANFRAGSAPQFTTAFDEFGLEDDQLWGVPDIVKNIENRVHQAQKNIANTANHIGQNVANIPKIADQAGQNVVKVVNHVGHNIERAANKFGLDLQKLRHAAEHGFSQAQQDFIRNAGPTIDALIQASGFTEAAQAWHHINWKNLSGLDVAIQLTALRVQEIYEAVNGIGGGKLDEMAIDVAEKITTIFCPQAGIWFEVGKLGLKGGKVALRVVGQTHDITDMLKTMEYRVRRGDWSGVAIESHKLFSLIVSDFAYEFRE
jgi:hypothetical protein